MDRRERVNDPILAMIAAQDGLRARIWTAMPGIVKSYDKDKNTCVIQPAIQAQVRTQAGTLTWVTLPQLLDCPVVFPSGGGFFLTFPLAADDEVLVVFSARCIDNWWDKGGVQQQAELRMHDLSDGFALPGPYSKPNVPSSISGDAVQLRSKDGKTAIQIDGQQNIKLMASGEVDVQAAGDINVSSDGSANVSASSLTTSAKSTTIGGGQVQIGSGGGALNKLEGKQETAFQNYIGHGNASAISNPVTPSNTSLNTTLTDGSINTGLAGLVGGGSITPTDATDIEAALGIGGGGGGLLAASGALQTHTDNLSGLLPPPTSPGVPFFQGLIGTASGLDYTAGTRFGTAETLLPGMYTGLTAASVVSAANAYAAGIVALLTIDPTQVAAVIAAVTAQTNALNAYVSHDTNNYASAQANITIAEGFLQLIGTAKNPNPATVTLVSQIMSPATIATLQSIK